MSGAIIYLSLGLSAVLFMVLIAGIRYAIDHSLAVRRIEELTDEVRMLRKELRKELCKDKDRKHVVDERV
jgi:hypothetical protein